MPKIKSGVGSGKRHIGEGIRVIGGKKFAASVNVLAAVFTVKPGTVSKYLKHPEAPKQEYETWWDVEKVKAHILRFAPPQLRNRMAAAAGEAPKHHGQLSWKDRKERAGALKAERELALGEGCIVNTDTFDRFCATTIPETVSQLRRLLESTLPAKLEGQTASRIRSILSKELDKILQRFEGEYKSFKDVAKEQALTSSKVTSNVSGNGAISSSESN